ncbi:MAG: DNA gyrase inhibitor YacG [Rubellimicrobium sp.]|nr:DNA gyrase inhibitor YacG [Rubellimicrobium sp.]
MKVKAPACPVCGRPADPRARPFCSTRCADVDLGRWLGGAYAIPAGAPPAGAGDGDDDAG